VAVSSLVANLGSRRRPTHLVRYPERTSRVHTVVSRTRRPTRVVPFPLPRGHQAHLAATTQLSQFRMRTNANPFHPSPPTPSTSVPPHPTLVIGVDVVLGRRSIRRRRANSLRHSHRSPARRRPAHTVPRIVRTIATHPFALDSIPHRGRRRRRHHRRARPHRRNGFSSTTQFTPSLSRKSIRPPAPSGPFHSVRARRSKRAREARAVLRRRARDRPRRLTPSLVRVVDKRVHFFSKENANNVNLKQHERTAFYTSARKTTTTAVGRRQSTTRRRWTEKSSLFRVDSRGWSIKPRLGGARRRRDCLRDCESTEPWLEAAAERPLRRRAGWVK